MLLCILGARDGREEEEEEAEKQEKEEEEKCVQQRQWRSPLAQHVEDADIERGVNNKLSMDAESDYDDVTMYE